MGKIYSQCFKTLSILSSLLCFTTSFTVCMTIFHVRDICTNSAIHHWRIARKKILLHARHFAVALEKARLRENALNISFQLLSVAPTSESSILIMVASIPVYSPATSLVGNYIDNRLWSTMVDFQNWPFWISRCQLSNEGNPNSSLMDNNFHL